MISIKADRLTFCGDMHLNASRPSCRIDDYPSVTIDKIRAIGKIMQLGDSKHLICLGDVFHKRTQSFAYLYQLMTAFRSLLEEGIQVYSIVGNHDISYERMDTLDSQPLGLMFQAGIIKRLTDLEIETSQGYQVRVRGFDYPDPIESSEECTGDVKVCVAHRFYNNALDHFSLAREEIKDLGYNVYVLGHDHINYPPEMVDGKLVLRPGALMRGTSHQYNLTRDVVVQTLIFNGEAGKPKLSLKTDRLDVRPAEEIFTVQSLTKSSSVSALLVDLEAKVEALVNRMDDINADTSIYTFLDSLEGLNPRVKKCIENALAEKGFFRPEIEVTS